MATTLTVQYEILGKIKDKKVLNKANKILSDFLAGVKMTVKTIKDHGTYYKTIAVGLWYRLVFKRGTWYLMSHERYTKEIKR